MGELDGKVTVVNGASAGIGWATASALAYEGASVVLADIDSERNERAACALEIQSSAARFVRTDVADDEQVAALDPQNLESFGGLDLAFNNAADQP